MFDVYKCTRISVETIRGWQEWKAHARASGLSTRATGPTQLPGPVTIIPFSLYLLILNSTYTITFTSYLLCTSADAYSKFPKRIYCWIIIFYSFNSLDKIIYTYIKLIIYFYSKLFINWYFYFFQLSIFISPKRPEAI